MIALMQNPGGDFSPPERSLDQAAEEEPKGETLLL